MGKVLFTSRRPLGRCENITAVYDAYDGDKDFIQEYWGNPDPRIKSGEFSVMVADDFVTYSPGKLIMITHGASGGKTYGLTQPMAYHSAKNASLIDYVVSTSEDTVELEARQHGVPVEKVLPLGMPRMDAYHGKKKGDGGIPYKGKRIYLYVPTFRRPVDPPMPAVNWDYIDSQLDSNELLIVKRHMITRDPLLGDRRYRHITEVPSGIPSAPYLIDSDVVITDYSSILFDAHVLGKPLILFEKKQGYVECRKMTYPYPDGYSSRYVTTEAELVACMKSAEGQNELDLLCKERSCGACDGHATERVVELIRRVADEDPDSSTDI